MTTETEIKATVLWAMLKNTVEALKTASMNLSGDARRSALYQIKLAEEAVLKYERIV